MQIEEVLTLPIPIPDEEKKLTQFFVSHFFCGTSKGIMMAFKAFIRPFDAPRRSVKTKNQTTVFPLISAPGAS